MASAHISFIPASVIGVLRPGTVEVQTMECTQSLDIELFPIHLRRANATIWIIMDWGEAGLDGGNCEMKILPREGYNRPQNY